MNSIRLGNQNLLIKDYYCDGGYGYVHRPDGKLWLYVNLTDRCNGHCPFCVNPPKLNSSTLFDLGVFQRTLHLIQNHIYGFSITGGEPMLDPILVDNTVSSIVDAFGHSVEIDIATNGTNLDALLQLSNLCSIDSIHLSRHMINDEENDKIFGFDTPSAAKIKSVLEQLHDPGKIVLNCVLMRDGIDSVEKIAQFLEFASTLGIHNTSFIGLSCCNEFCENHYLDPAELDFSQDSRFHIWNHYQDHAFCSCSSGSFEAKNRSTRFYYRRIGSEQAKYTRQLVYNPNNRLYAGFNGDEIKLK